ncbi:MAG: hypothetical protein ACK4UJ_00335 [Leptonema sp. (in: bacteria)]
MAIYTIPKEQKKDTFVYLRIMVYTPYLFYLEEIKNRFSDNTEMFFYLSKKYKQKFKELAAQKSSSKKKYQEVTCEYTNLGIRVAPSIHQILKNISDATGYSISAIVRFFIEWEFLGELASLNQVGRSVELDLSSETVITKMELKHQYFIEEERVEEIFEFS